MSEAKKQKRNWSKYNEHLVQRGEILLSVESLKGWQRELEEMNEGKKTLWLSAQPHPVHGHAVVHAKKWERMVQELRLKVWVYNLLIGLGVGLSGT